MAVLVKFVKRTDEKHWDRTLQHTPLHMRSKSQQEMRVSTSVFFAVCTGSALEMSTKNRFRNRVWIHVKRSCCLWMAR
jgi:hypothetical protein